jgi:DNA-binding IclR family transcriptional regulator
LPVRADLIRSTRGTVSAVDKHSNTDQKGHVIQALDRGLEILETLAQQSGEVSLAKLALHFPWNKSTTHRLLATLVRRGHVEKDPQTSKYRLGLAILTLSRGLNAQMEIIRLARPFIERLALDSRETSHLAVLERGEVVVLDQYESPEKIRVITSAGMRMPAHCTALGKALLAGLKGGEYDRWVEAMGLPRLTAKTTTDPEVLREHLVEIAQQGYAYDDEEYDPGMCCMAGPVHNQEGVLVAAIGISCPSNRIAIDQIDRLSELVKSTAAGISSLLGHGRQAVRHLQNA